MKWKDLSLKERKQIYDSVRANNPDATYFDIKEQFDSIPTYVLWRRTRKQIINMKELEGVCPLYPVPSYKNGGIHIKKSKRGTFKAAAKKAGMGVQEYANKVLKKGSKASPAMKKKANFARNAAKWKH